MKNFKRILMIILALSLVFTLIACGDKTCKHADEDEDGLCDECGECLDHVDDDEDGYCDTCEECYEHYDDDEDGVCDNCEEDMPTCDHTDEDEDGFCDECDECMDHVDDDEDGICDNCDGAMESSGDGLALIEDGEILFNVVLGSDIKSSVRMTVDAYVDALDAIGATLTVGDEKSKEGDIEILIGTVTSRGEDYEYDKYSLGGEGYVISLVNDDKIIINGGSEKALINAFTVFFEDYLGITDDVEEIEDFYYNEKHEALEIQDDYRITSISIGEEDLKGYTISRSRGDGVTDELALKLQTFFYERAGYYLKIVDHDDAGDKTISFKLVSKGKAGGTGFRARLDGKNLIIECAHQGKFAEAFDEFYATFSTKQGDVEIEKFDGETDFTTVYYKDFGVKGDGKTDDSAAIRAAHQEANKNNQTVVGDKNATYYIAKVDTPIIIKTDVDWRGAKFIFDASKFNPEDSGNVFKIDNDNMPTNFYTKDDPTLAKINATKGEDGLVIRGINHGDNQTTKIDVGIREPLMLKVYNSDARAYIRWGYVDTKGGAQCEVIIVDENGNIDPTTPFLLDYEKVTQITAYKIDVEPITIKNANVESRNSLVNLLGGYKSIAHSFELARPNVTMENLIHTITQEYVYETPTRKNPVTGLWEDVSSEGFTIKNGIVYQNNKQYNGDDVKPFTGYSYSGFIQVSNTHNSLIKGCGFQARYHYEEGTYDISCSYANKIEFRDCTQNNFFVKDANGNDTQQANVGTYWGVAGTNYCKNMYYIDSVLTRYDAHCGVFNGGVIGGKLAVLRLIGGGTFTIEGVDFHTRGVPVQLREDYGATFNGTVIIKDTKFYSSWGSNNYVLTLIDAPTAHIYNGYKTYFPSVVIDNISVETTAKTINVLGLCNQAYSTTGEHFPARCPIRDNAHDPEALFTYYYETANPNIVEEQPEKFPFLEGRTKNTKQTNPDKLTDKEYGVLDHGNGTYTVVANKVKNVQPYNPPEFIKILNMKDVKNMNGEKMELQLYKSSFFDNTEIIDEDGVLKWVTAPKK